MSTPQEETQILPGRGQVLRAATIVSVAFLISRVLGFVRGAIIVNIYSLDTIQVNAYEIASRLPDTLFYIIAGGALGSAFIPTFAAYFVRDDEAGGWRLFSAILNLITVVLVVVSALAAIFAREFLSLFYFELMAEQPGLLELSTELTRVMLLSTIIFGISGVFMAALNARQHFVLPAIAPIVYNVGIIVGTIALAPNVMGIALGTVAGAAGHMLIQIPGLRLRRARYSPILTARDPGVQQVIRLMIPRMLGLSFGQVNHFVLQFMGQFMLFGSIPALTNAWRVVLLPQGAIGQALGIVAFPTLAALAAQRSLAQMRRILADSLRLISFLGIPATMILMVLSRPIIALLFQRGAFDAQDTLLVAWALAFYALGLVGLSALEVISRAFYSLEDTWTPVLAGGVQLLVMAALGYWLSGIVFPAWGWLSLGGLALAVSISSTIEAGGLLWLLRPRLGGVDGHHLWDGVWRMSLAGLVMGGVMWAAYGWLVGQGVGMLWQLVLGSLAGGGVYLLLCWLLRVQEIGQFWAMARQRLGR